MNIYEHLWSSPPIHHWFFWYFTLSSFFRSLSLYYSSPHYTHNTSQNHDVICNIKLWFHIHEHHHSWKISMSKYVFHYFIVVHLCSQLCIPEKTWNCTCSLYPNPSCDRYTWWPCSTWTYQKQLCPEAQSSVPLEQSHPNGIYFQCPVWGNCWESVATAPFHGDRVASKALREGGYKTDPWPVTCGKNVHASATNISAIKLDISVRQWRGCDYIFEMISAARIHFSDSRDLFSEHLVFPIPWYHFVNPGHNSLV